MEEETNKFGPDSFGFTFVRKDRCRYGENPQQPGAIFQTTDMVGLEKIIDRTLMDAQQLQGKTMSFNNFLDANANLKLMREFNTKVNEFEEKYWCTITKHANPAGVAGRKEPKRAFSDAWNCDPLSAFGGIVCTNFTIDEEIAELMLADKRFIEAVIAPHYTPQALDVFKKKENLRVLEMNVSMPEYVEFDLRFVTGGVLLQETDRTRLTKETLTYPNDLVKDLGFDIKKPTDEQIKDMIFGWYVNRNTKSNTVLLVKDRATVGIGAGQQNRVDSGFIAGFRANKPYKEISDPKKRIEELSAEQEELLCKAGVSKRLYQLVKYFGLNIEGRSQGAIAVSSAFYPQPDTPYVLGLFGVEASLSPSGSIKDKVAYKAMHEMGMAAAHTDLIPEEGKEGYKGGRRAFLH